ncbi:SpoVR family protein [Motiliproteus coralliicola]|uniref:SpoVR family protein n=1 Tax=Motiliproteus coralliicola TaxID=2283196 RepID=A0A369WF19_9GAMM|nr:SpoVR family protein [Motiliproteus coralliicola]RDE19951.1 SpoVR family protein [Motiliproteus coralliicola]
MKRKQPISTGSEWTFELLERYDSEIAKSAQKFGLDTYPNQIEVISSEQMMDAYSSVGMPLNYHHWSFGKQFVSTQQNYQRGHMGLAYEIVINSSPCIAYLMEENTMTMQALVIAHACYGHNSFFKGNYLFQTWTNASAIIDYLLFAKHYIAKCEERHGIEEVEKLLDSCHALMNYGVNRYKRPSPISAEEEKKRQETRTEILQQQVNELWDTIPKSADADDTVERQKRFPAEPEENLLYFLEKNAPLLEPWQREVIRIVRKVAQYFYPQKQTQVMNEGWACFWHYTLLHDLYDQGLVTDGFMMEFLHSHSSVVYQPPFDSPYFSGINPYTLGYHMMQDLRRICEKPSDEDREWFPEIAGSDWQETLQDAMNNYKDESFIQQFLSPNMMRELHLFSIVDDEREKNLLVSAIHNESGFIEIRRSLAEQYNLGSREPNIQVWDVNVRGDRALTLRHFQHNNKPLGDSTDEMLKHVHRLWGFDVHLESLRGDEVMKTYHCPPPAPSDAA